MNIKALLKWPLIETLEWTEALASLCPGRIGQGLRRTYYALALKSLGRHAVMEEGMKMMTTKNISIGNDFFAMRGGFICAIGGGAVEIGDRVSFASNVVVDAGENGVIRIGNDVGIAHNCVLRSSPHNYSDPNKPFKSQGHKPGSIIIEDDVWVAANVILSPGTHIERGCVVASGSVVGGRIKAFSIVAGNPARVIGKRGA